MLRLVLPGLAVVAIAACRTDLDAPRDTDGEPEGSGAGSSSSTGGGVELPPPPCTMVPAGDAAVVMAFPDRHAVTPSVRVVDDGATERVLLQAFAQGGANPAHPDIQVAEHRIGAAWPEALQRVSGPTLLGIEAHSWGLLAPSPASRNEMTLAWYGDPGGYSRPMLRRIDLVSGAVSDPIDVAEDGEVALDLVAGGDGYAMAWRRYVPENPDYTSVGLALLDLDGVVRAGPFPLTAPHPSPGNGVALAWTGSAYLAAIAFDACEPGDTLCQEDTVVVASIDPATGAAQPAASFPAAPLASATRPALGTWGGRTYIAWAEGTPDLPTERVLRLAALTPSGAAEVRVRSPSACGHSSAARWGGGPPEQAAAVSARVETAAR